MERLLLEDKDLLDYFWYYRDDYFGDTGDTDSEKHVMDCHCGVEKVKIRTSFELVCPKCGFVGDTDNFGRRERHLRLWTTLPKLPITFGYAGLHFCMISARRQQKGSTKS